MSNSQKPSRSSTAAAAVSKQEKLAAKTEGVRPDGENSPNTVDSAAEIPEFMKGGAGAGFDNLGLEDYSWLGSEGTLDPDDILEESGYDPEPPLEVILLAIIDAHNPKDAPSRQERLENALEALTGVRRKRGMDEKEGDYELLLQIAWKYFAEFHNNPSQSPNLAPIIREIVEKLPKNDLRIKNSDPVSVVRRLRDKFNAEKDTLLTRVTSEFDWHRMDTLFAIKNILEAMGELRIPFRVDSVTPRSVARR